MRRILLRAARTAGLLGFLIAAAAIAVRQPSFQALGSRGAAPADASRLRHDVETLAGTFAPRDVQHPPNLERAAAFREEELAAAGAGVSSQPVSTREGPMRNIIARLGPDVGPIVIVGAHYDAFGEFVGNPGADDNASGAAGLLEVARTAFLRNGNYHAPGDTPATLDYVRMAHTVDGVANAVLWLANHDGDR